MSFANYAPFSIALSIEPFFFQETMVYDGFQVLQHANALIIRSKGRPPAATAKNAEAIAQ